MRSSSFPGLLTLVLCLSGVVGACGATGPAYPEFAARQGNTPPDVTRIVLMRPADRYDDYSASRADVRVNGQDVGRLAYGGFISVDVAAGDVTIWTSARNRFGNPLIKSCELQMITSPGVTIYVDVAPRTASVVAGVVGAVAGTAAVPTSNTYGINEIGQAIIVDPALEGAAGNVVAVVVGAAESAGKTCGGYFGLALLPHSEALVRLEALRLSN